MENSNDVLVIVNMASYGANKVITVVIGVGSATNEDTLLLFYPEAVKTDYSDPNVYKNNIVQSDIRSISEYKKLFFNKIIKYIVAWSDPSPDGVVQGPNLIKQRIGKTLFDKLMQRFAKNLPIPEYMRQKYEYSTPKYLSDIMDGLGDYDFDGFLSFGFTFFIEK